MLSRCPGLSPITDDADEDASRALFTRTVTISDSGACSMATSAVAIFVRLAGASRSWASFP